MPCPPSNFVQTQMPHRSKNMPSWKSGRRDLQYEQPSASVCRIRWNTPNRLSISGFVGNGALRLAAPSWRHVPPLVQPVASAESCQETWGWKSSQACKNRQSSLKMSRDKTLCQRQEGVSGHRRFQLRPNVCLHAEKYMHTKQDMCGSRCPAAERGRKLTSVVAMQESTHFAQRPQG